MSAVLAWQVNVSILVYTLELLRSYTHWGVLPQSATVRHGTLEMTPTEPNIHAKRRGWQREPSP
eukprot:11217153-Heterocapsa_arctica.AAC.1